MQFGKLSDREVVGTQFIDKDSILDLVSEEDIFKLVFGFEPIEFEYISSPFREDENPGAWFYYSPSGKMFFVDFGDPIRTHYDCFNAVQAKYGLPDLFSTLKFIKNHFTGNPQDISINSLTKRARKSSSKAYIQIIPRDFVLKDKAFWSRYGISRNNLTEDKVFAIKSFSVRKGVRVSNIKCYNPSYCYTNFEEGKKKIYRPYNKDKRFKFLTDCRSNDIGEISSLVPFGRQLVISKSYKDCRVLRNQGLNSVWVQNEGCVPSLDILIPLCKRFSSTIIFYDNDETGIRASKKLSNIVNTHLPGNSRPLYLSPKLGPKISDPADLYWKRGEQELKLFLRSKNLSI